MNAPDPGEGYRLVDIDNEPPYGTAQLWLPCSKIWAAPSTNRTRYCDAYYRVPIDPPPVPQNEPWSDIPPCESNPAAVVLWIIGALVFLTGFLIGWSL